MTRSLGAKAFIFSSLLICIFACPLTVHAKETRYKDYPVETREGDRIVFSGFKANIRLQQVNSGKNAVFRVRKSLADKATAEDAAKFDALSFSVRRDGSTILVEAKGPDSKTAWQSWLKPAAPELSIEIDAPALPVEILAHEGQVSVANFHQSVAVSLVNGHVKTQQTEGLLRVQLQSGGIVIDKHRGRLEVDSYGAKLAVQDLEGDLDLANFSGESNIVRTKGNIDFKSHLGPVVVSKSSGSVDFLSGKGSFTLTGFEGPVRGQTDQGAVVIGVDGNADVHVESNQGSVSVKLPGDSSAFVRMQTEEGSMTPPDAIKAAGSGRSRIVSGRLVGEGPGGTVAVKSKSGSLRVRL